MGERTRVVHTGGWLMSGVYWGIVVGFVAMVGTFFVCIGLVRSNAEEPPTAPGGKIDGSGEEVRHAAIVHRRAA